MTSLKANAQNFEISGTVRDTMNFRNVSYVAVSLIRKSDSILVKTTRTSQQGKFNLKVTVPGTYIIMASHSEYMVYVDELVLDEKKTNIDLGILPLLARTQFLREVTIKSSAGVRIKGDTLEFLADSFKVKQNATVEDLLKVLPGMQVNKKGEITAMGEKVEKVLVDGEEFFGDDPTVATQNLQSRIVDKVQVFDKKSDQAQFTGFDDGQSQKTINLKLKKGMNKGEFGKVEVSGGPDDRWQSQAMVNVFKDKQKFSVYGIMSSLGKTGLGWEDRNAYTGQGDNFNMNDENGGMMMMSGNSDDFDPMGQQEGITKSYIGGAHYSNRWNDGKEHVNTNYSFGRINKLKQEHSVTENLFPQNKYMSQDSSNSFDSRNQHRLTAKYDFAIDTATTIYVNVNGKLAFVDNETYNLSKNKTYTDVPLSGSERNNNSTAINSSASTSVTLNHKMKKTGRTISVSGGYDYTKNESDGTLIGSNNYFLGGNPVNETLDQKKKNEGLAQTANASAVYTEALSKKWLLKLNYKWQTDVNSSQKNTLVKDTNNEYVNRIDSLSNDFHSNVNSHTAGLELKYSAKKYYLTVGGNFKRSNFVQEDLIRVYHYNYNRLNVFPTLRLNYNFSQFSKLNINYSGNTTQPSITQIQPIRDNSNPLQIYVGNPNLKMGYSQNINVMYFNYNVMANRSVYFGGSGSNQYNMVATNRYFDTLGRTINEYVNLNGYYRISGWGGYSRRIGKTAFEGRMNLSGSYGRTPNIANSVNGMTQTLDFTLKPGITYNKEEKYYASLDLGATYNNSVTTQQNSRNIKYYSFNPSANIIRYYKNLEVGTDAEYMYNPPVSPYPNKFSRLVWNGYVSYKLLPKQNLELKASVHDILNQNRGYSRTSSNSMNTERYYLTLGRYYLFGIVYNFKHGAMAEVKGPPGAGGMRMNGMPRKPGGGGRRPKI